MPRKKKAEKELKLPDKVPRSKADKYTITWRPGGGNPMKRTGVAYWVKEAFQPMVKVVDAWGIPKRHRR